VFNTYGELSNSELLRKYGYTETHNTLREQVTVPVDAVIAAILPQPLTLQPLLLRKLKYNPHCIIVLLLKSRVELQSKSIVMCM
jgi:hypothetical protein